MIDYPKDYADLLDMYPPQRLSLFSDALQIWETESKTIFVFNKRSMIPFRRKVSIKVEGLPPQILSKGTAAHCSKAFREIRNDLEQRQLDAYRREQRQAAAHEKRKRLTIASAVLMLGMLSWGGYWLWSFGDDFTFPQYGEATTTTSDATTRGMNQDAASYDFTPSLSPPERQENRESILEVVEDADDAKQDNEPLTGETNQVTSGQQEPQLTPSLEAPSSPETAETGDVAVKTLPLLDRFGSAKDAPRETPEYIKQRKMNELRDADENEYGISRLPDENSYVGVSGDVTLATPGGGNLDEVEELADFGFKLD